MGDVVRSNELLLVFAAIVALVISCLVAGAAGRGAGTWGWGVLGPAGWVVAAIIGATERIIEASRRIEHAVGDKPRAAHSVAGALLPDRPYVDKPVSGGAFEVACPSCRALRVLYRSRGDECRCACGTVFDDYSAEPPKRA